MKQLFFLISLLSAYWFSAAQSSVLWMDELEVKSFSEGIPSVMARKNQRGDSLRIAGRTFAHGMGFASTAVFPMQLSGKGIYIETEIGIDDASDTSCTCRFFIIGDRKILFQSPRMKRSDAARFLSVDVTGIDRLGLLVLPEEESISNCYSNWTNTRIAMHEGSSPRPVPNLSSKFILTPSDPPAPRIHTPLVFGARPGNPVLFHISTSGERPIIFNVANLPQGLSLDTVTGIINGTIYTEGSYMLELSARNSKGVDRRPLKIIIGNTIARTPPMGWNGWNSWAREIDREKVMASAKAMVSMGLRDHGWTYINIDDAWQGERRLPSGPLQPNQKFPAFKEMIDSIHAMGLKVGIYSTPWITSYAGYPGGSTETADGSFPDSVRNDKRSYRRVGKYQYEAADAKQFAAWGIDYLKYDWRIDLKNAERMSKALQESGRDIIYSLSNSAPYSLAAEWSRMANLWRTGPDIRDSWHALYKTVFKLQQWTAFAGPGHWNDPDMMVLGQVTTGSPMHPTRLTPDEQYSEVSMFALLSAPLLIGCPIEKLDSFTLSLLKNAEVIAVDQDPLGSPATFHSSRDGVEAWVKAMQDGSKVIGLFHTADYGKTPQSYFRWDDEPDAVYTFRLNDFSLPEGTVLRDLWRQNNISSQKGNYRFSIPHHGVLLLRTLSTEKK